MDIKEYIFLLIVIVIISGFCSYFTYKVLNTKINLLSEELEDLRNQIPSGSNKEHFKNIHNELRNKYPKGGSEKIEPTRNINLFNSTDNLRDSNIPITAAYQQPVDKNDKSSDVSSITQTQNEVDMLKKELHKIETLINTSDSEYDESSYSENSSNSEDEIENEMDVDDESYEDDDSADEEQLDTDMLKDDINSNSVDNNLINLVNRLEAEEKNSLENCKKNNYSEFDELANIENDGNSELNDLIRKDGGLNNYDIIENIETNNNSNNEEVLSIRSKESSISSPDNTNKIEYENIARQFIKNDLKDICKLINLPLKGNKLDLIEKIFQAGRQDLIMLKINA